MVSKENRECFQRSFLVSGSANKSRVPVFWDRTHSLMAAGLRYDMEFRSHS